MWLATLLRAVTLGQGLLLFLGRLAMAREVDHRPDVRLGWAFATVLAVCTAGPVLWALAVRDRLPVEVVRHWGLNGQATATWSLSAQLAVLSGMTLVVAGGLGAVAVLGRQPLVMRRFLAGCAAWTATFLAALQVDGMRAQLDVADPMGAVAPSAGIAVGAVAGLAVACAVASQVSEPSHGKQAVTPPAPSLPRLHAEPSLPWRRTTPVSRAILVGVVVTLVAFGVPALAGSWGFLGVGAVVAVIMLALARWSVEIDRGGLTVRNGPITLLRVPVAEVAEAWALDDLNPFWEFGGWGLRVDVRGRTGIVGRKGPALGVRRGDGSEVIISIDDAAEAAATLNTLADRRHDTGT